VINEILINGPGPNDGQNSPNTEEWIELYNTCNVAIDMSCYVLTDGDYGVTIPSGTVLAPGAYYTIGSVNAGFVVDLDLATCGCAGGTNVGVLTNGDEQMLLFDDTGTLQDGLIWGGGQMPVNFYQVAYTGCMGQNNTCNDANLLENLPSGGAQGCVLQRSCDGSDEWIENCVGASPGSSNGGTPDYEIEWPETSICTGDCIEWALTDYSGVLTLDWNISGAINPNSTDLTPTACYDNPGLFDISVTITSACGPQNLSFTDIIEVLDLSVSITNTTALPICPGDPVSLEANGTGTYQWFLDNSPIANSNNSLLSVDEDGNYLVELTSGNCSAFSNVISIDYAEPPALTVAVTGNTILCPSNTVSLTSSNNAINVQWYNGITSLGTLPTLTTDTGGLYYYTTTVDGCIFYSDSVSIVSEATLDLQLQASDTTPCPDTDVTLTLNTLVSSVQWLRNGTSFLNNTLSQINVDQSGTYTAEILTINGCPYTSNAVEINFINLVAPTIGSNTSEQGICANTSLTLSATGNYDSFEWLFDGNTVGTSASIEASESGEYIVVGLSNDCSVLSEPFVVIDFPTPQFALPFSDDINTCQNNFLVEIASDDELIWLYEGNVISLGNPAVLQFEGQYTVYSINSNGCVSAEQTFGLDFVDAPEIEITTSDSTPCVGDIIALNAIGDFESWSWQDDEQGAQRSINIGGHYVVFGSSANGCENSAEIEIEFTPLPALDIPETLESNCSTGALLQAITEGEVSWLNSQMTMIGLGQALQVNPEQDEIYTAISVQNGCITERHTLVTVDCDVLYVPSAITPNGDGVNDVFRVVANGYSVYMLRIFDRWGQVVFESNDPTDTWTGGVDTHFVGDGIYHYRLEILDPEGLPIHGRSIHEGHITVIR